jgi:hypothetical protein
LINKPEFTGDLRVLFVLNFKFLDFATATGGINLRVKELVIPGLHRQDILKVVGLQIPDMRSIGTERILGDDHWQLGMVFPDLPEAPPAGIPLAIVFVFSVLGDNHFRREREHSFLIRMDNGGSYDLLIIGHFPCLAGDLFWQDSEQIVSEE